MACRDTPCAVLVYGFQQAAQGHGLVGGGHVHFRAVSDAGLPAFEHHGADNKAFAGVQKLAGFDSVAAKSVKMRDRGGFSKVRPGLIYEPFVLDLWIVPEVHQQAQLLTGRLQVVDHLSAVFVGQLLDSLDFQDDLSETNKVRFILLLQPPTLVLAICPVISFAPFSSFVVPRPAYE
jgi:hypothetical protein